MAGLVLRCCRELMAEARNSPDREICGVVFADHSYRQLTNRSRDPDHFQFCRKEWGELKNSGEELFAVYHSHRSGDCTPSAADLASQQRHRLALIIVTSTDWSITFYE